MSDAPTIPNDAETPAATPRVHPVWWLNVVLVAASVVAVVAVNTDVGQVAAPHLEWWMLAPAFALAERCVVHLHFKRSSHSFSLGELPLVFGLVFASSQDLLVALAASTLPVLALERRLPPIKTVFNLAQLTLTTCLAIIVFDAIAPATSTQVGPQLWVAAVAAIQAAGLSTVVLIAAAISLSDGPLGPKEVARMVMTDGVVAMSNTSVALAGAVVMASDARGLVLLAVPMGTVFMAYRAYQAERERQGNLDFLYETTRELSRTPEVAGALEGLLERSLEAFRAEYAGIVLFGAQDQPSLRTSIGPGDQRSLMESVDPAVAAEMRAVLSPERPVMRVHPSDAPPALAARLQAIGARSAMLAMLPGENGTVGAMLVANRAGVVREFGGDDLKLFEALANNASVALQYDQMEQAVGELRDIQEQLEHQAFHDALTQLPNRALFLERVEELLADEGSRAGVLFVDVDDFKTVNDTLGHEAGDALLVTVARRLEGCVRPEDTVARFGGDEFAVLVTDAGHEAHGAALVGERILAAFDEPTRIAGHTVSVHTSVGIATGAPGSSAADLLRHADLAMYEAKQAGKGRYRVFHAAPDGTDAPASGVREDLERAIARGEFTLCFQPIVSLADGTCTGSEALVRWRHPERGLVSPADFIPAAEETGLIVAVGQIVLDEACRQVRTWEERDPSLAPLAVHVNLSPVELTHPDLCATVQGALERSGLMPAQLVLEIDERLLLRDADAAVAALTRLRAVGVRLALDGFGTGPAALGHLRVLPVDMLKLARPLVEGVARSERDAAFARTIIELAKLLGLTVAAEGIETPEQIEILRSFDCDLGQGFHIGRPLADMDEQFRPLQVPAGAWPV